MIDTLPKTQPMATALWAEGTQPLDSPAVIYALPMYVPSILLGIMSASQTIPTSPELQSIYTVYGYNPGGTVAALPAICA